MANDPAIVATSMPEDDVLSRGLVRLGELLPSSWQLLPVPDAEGKVTPGAVMAVQDPQGLGTRLIIDPRRSISPRDVDQVLGGQLQLVRRLDPWATVLVIAPWLSPRTRELLTERGFAYLDLTGNVRMQIDRPGLVILTSGAEQDPAPRRREGVWLRGAVAGRVVRLLADVRPPYTATAIARAAGVSIPHVSRLLQTLDREALVQRGRRGMVVDVDWTNLLRRRAETYRLFRTNQAQGYLSGTGAREAVRQLQEDGLPYAAVTGSFAAARRAPIAAPSQLALYVDDPQQTAEALGLLPTDQGADVILLRPYDSVVLVRTQSVDGLRVVGLSQLALDCLGGNGRMPAEGEALLEWMAQHEHEWREQRIEGFPADKTTV